MVRTARRAGDGLLAARRARRQRPARSHACAYWRSTWLLGSRSGNVIAIPESGSVAHVKENAVALSLTLTPEEIQTLDAAHPPPHR